MILNTLQRLVNGNENRNRTATSSGRGPIGVQVSSVGHTLIIRPRVRVPSAIRPSFNDRGEVTEFSASSAARMRRYLRGCLPEYSVLITLTYPFGHGYDGARSKRDLKVFLQRLRRNASRMGGDDLTYSAFWFAEFQRRGSLHYHIFTTHKFPKDWIAQSWYDICGTEDERHLRAGTRIESIRSGRHGISAYASKYAAKQTQKVVPEDFGWIGRFWGVSGWRGHKSADTWLEPEDTGTRAVVRRINQLESEIKQGISSGECTVTPYDGGTFVVYCHKLSLQLTLFGTVLQMGNAVQLYRHDMRSSIFDVENENDSEMLQQT